MGCDSAEPEADLDFAAADGFFRVLEALEAALG